MTPSPTDRRLRRAIGAATTALATVAVLLAAPAAAAEPPAEEQPAATAAPAPEGHAATANTMTFAGRGWGHGRGLSQWGSQGYARDHGWSSARILDHYYGGTTAGQASAASSRPVDASAVRIRLIAQDARPLVVGISGGTLGLSGTGPLGDPDDLTAVRLTKQGDGTLLVETAATCAGPWSVLGGDGRTGTTAVTVTRTSGADQLHTCLDGTTTWYPGSLRATVVDGTQRAVNTTTIEAALRSIVPRESPASWDADALQAQAVAARSYALAGDSRHRASSGTLYADTCDTTLCQVYAGHSRQVPGGSRTATTDSRTDAAITATAGVVRLHADGRIARTEFSSTSGGWTAGGTFPAVQDLGDVISPLHTWTRTVAVTGLESAYGQGGALQSVEVLERNGLGADGGRVLRARLRFSNGVTADVSGNTIRSRAGLLSDWFRPACPVEAAYIDAVHRLFLERAATGDEIRRWCPDVQRGERFPLTDALSVSDEWAGVQIEGLYTKILDRPSEPGGRAYWLEQVAGGLRIEDIAAEFYGSAEYFRRAGSTNRGYVERLYDDLLGRTADAEGRDFWVRLLDRGQISRVGAADEFYASIESRTDRVVGLFETVLGRFPDPGGRDYWVGQLRTLGDVRLAAWLAASAEFFSRSIR